MKTIVAVRNKKRKADMYLFPTKKAALSFVRDMTKQFGDSFQYLITVGPVSAALIKTRESL